MSWIASVYECRSCTTLTWSNLNLACIICMVGSRGYLLSARGHSIFGKYLNAHLKFTVYGHKQTCTLQTHFRNAVPLVWGSLRLVPISILDPTNPQYSMLNIHEYFSTAHHAWLDYYCVSTTCMRNLPSVLTYTPLLQVKCASGKLSSIQTVN